MTSWRQKAESSSPSTTPGCLPSASSCQVLVGGDAGYTTVCRGDRTRVVRRSDPGIGHRPIPRLGTRAGVIGGLVGRGRRSCRAAAWSRLEWVGTWGP